MSVRELQPARRYILSVISRQTITMSEGTNYCWVVQYTSSVTCAAITSLWTHACGMNGIMTGLPLNHVLSAIERNLLRLSGNSSRIWTERFAVSVPVWLFQLRGLQRTAGTYCDVVLVMLLERSVEIPAYSNVLIRSIVSLDLHREKEILWNAKKKIRNRWTEKESS